MRATRYVLRLAEGRAFLDWMADQHFTFVGYRRYDLTDGPIKLSVPVSGDLASRQFDLSDAFWAAMRETAVSVMALPISWVGKIFYTEDARIETVRIWPVYFEPGTTRITRDFEQHAERLAGFLRDAPGLTLAMKPVHTVEDIVALKGEAVRRRIEALIIVNNRAEGNAPATIRALAEAWRERDHQAG